MVKQIFTRAHGGILSPKTKADELSFQQTSVSGLDYLTCAICVSSAFLASPVCTSLTLRTAAYSTKTLFMSASHFLQSTSG